MKSHKSSRWPPVELLQDSIVKSREAAILPHKEETT